MIGKINHASGLLIVLRPFMDPLWAAWGSPSPEDHPGCVWTKQIITELIWFDVFVAGNGQRIERFFSLDAYNRVGTIVEIGTDASPWGIGDGSPSMESSPNTSLRSLRLMIAKSTRSPWQMHLDSRCGKHWLY